MKRIVVCLLVLTALALGVNAENTTYDYGYRADTVSLQDTLYSGIIISNQKIHQEIPLTKKCYNFAHDLHRVVYFEIENHNY